MSALHQRASSCMSEPMPRLKSGPRVPSEWASTTKRHTTEPSRRKENSRGRAQGSRVGYKDLRKDAAVGNRRCGDDIHVHDKVPIERTSHTDSEGSHSEQECLCHLPPRGKPSGPGQQGQRWCVPRARRYIQRQMKVRLNKPSYGPGKDWVSVSPVTPSWQLMDRLFLRCKGAEHAGVLQDVGDLRGVASLAMYRTSIPAVDIG